MATDTAAPVENLVRAVFGPEAAELRAAVDDQGDGRTLHGYFAVFNQWTEIKSHYEGHFLERIAPGAFAATLADRADKIKVLYDHGQDPTLGNKPLGPITALEEDRVGARYEVQLLDVPYNNEFIIPASRAGLLGASFRFGVTDEVWNDTPKRSAHNPDGISERTITGAHVLEFGPVTFPAYEGASASVRCGTDRFFDHLASDPRFVARFTERVGRGVVEKILAEMPDGQATQRSDDGAPPPAEQNTKDSADGQDDRWSPEARAARLAAITTP
jgi:HK97 family phage prohead protease